MLTAIKTTVCICHVYILLCGSLVPRPHPPFNVTLKGGCGLGTRLIMWCERKRNSNEDRQINKTIKPHMHMIRPCHTKLGKLS